LSLLAGHLFQCLDARVFTNVLAKDRDVDVFGEALNQAEAL